MMDIPLQRIVPAAWNPRQSRSEERMSELIDSVREHGVIQPIVVKPYGTSGDGGKTYQIVCGSRRFEASKALELSTIPAICRDVDDQTAAELAMAENIQDEDMSPIDEALGYKYLISKESPINDIARRLGVTVSHVRRRLRLLTGLHAKAQEMLAAGRITLAHADHLVRIPVKDHELALSVCVTQTIFDDIEEPAPVGRLAEWIGKNVKLDMDEEAIQDYLVPDVADGWGEVDVDTVPKMLKLSWSQQPGSDLGDKKHGLIGRKSWVEIGEKLQGEEVPDCENAVEGVIVHGAPMRVVRCCAKKGCPVHRPSKEDKAATEESKTDDASADKPLTDNEKWRVEQARSEEEARQWEDERPVVIKAFVEYLKEKGLKLDAEFVRKAVNLGETERYFATIYGDDWEFKDEDIPVVLAVAHVGWWHRGRTRDAMKDYGFKMPRRPKAALKAVKEAGDRVEATIRKKGGKK